MEIFGVRFAPLNVPLERRLQSAAVFVGVFIFTFGVMLSAYIVLYAIIAGGAWSRCLMLAYLVFIYFDSKYHLSVNRPEWLYCFYGQRRFWDYYTGYFPMRLIKTAELEPTRNYILGAMPHGIIPLGLSIAFVNDSLDSKGLFPGLEFRPLSLHLNFLVPFMREHLLNLSVCSCGKESMEHLLSSKPRHGRFTGRALVLLVGGGSEARRSRPGSYNLELKRKKGFVKMALQYGTALVPVISFGEADIYEQIAAPEGSLLGLIQRFVREYIGFTPVWFNGRGFFQYSFGLMPRRAPINIVVGSAMDVPKISNPSVEQIDQYHAMFVEQTVKLFEAHKSKYIANYRDVSLKFE
ncbi:diacylglycerol O-acyltransferase 2-like [Phymastichus coffea]|uniref:diacylglycerol O-acyltransferase 2-like n=1 Tax=Phymastichus coffea TaxID=108790 RepID=UPI00273C7DEE|nr:diacylglycerol O-acyltransferase 2-like [Phymastichus coffea]